MADPRPHNFIDALPVSATGKVLKNRLRDEYGQILMREER